MRGVSLLIPIYYHFWEWCVWTICILGWYRRTCPTVLPPNTLPATQMPMCSRLYVNNFLQIIGLTCRAAARCRTRYESSSSPEAAHRTWRSQRGEQDLCPKSNTYSDYPQANVLIDKNGHACICDFGLSRFMKDFMSIDTTFGGTIR